MSVCSRAKSSVWLLAVEGSRPGTSAATSKPARLSNHLRAGRRAADRAVDR